MNSAQRSAIADHVMESTDSLRSIKPKTKCVLLGDFNSTFGANLLAQQLNIEQIVSEPTRATSILDTILADYESQDVPKTLPARRWERRTIVQGFG